jgi:hypothetical protein
MAFDVIVVIFTFHWRHVGFNLNCTDAYQSIYFFEIEINFYIAFLWRNEFVIIKMKYVQ